MKRCFFVLVSIAFVFSANAQSAIDTTSVVESTNPIDTSHFGVYKGVIRNYETDATVYITEEGITFSSEVLVGGRRAGTYWLDECDFGEGSFTINLDKSSRDKNGLMTVSTRESESLNVETMTYEPYILVTISLSEFGQIKTYSIKCSKVL